MIANLQANFASLQIMNLSHRHLSGILLIVFAFCQPSTSLAQVASVAPRLSASDLREIDFESEPYGKPPSSLAFYPSFSGQTATAELTESGQKWTKKLRLSTRQSRGKYIVLRWDGAKNEAENSIEFVSHDARSNLYRRWRLLPSNTVIESVGIPSTEISHLSLVGDSVTISWSDVARSGQHMSEEPHQKLHATETFTRSNGVFAKLRWDCVSTLNADVTFRVKVQFDSAENVAPKIASTPKTSKDEPKSDFFTDALNTMFGVNKQPPNRVTPAEYRFEDFNFALKNPGKDFESLDTKRILPDACLILSKRRPTEAVTVIAENLSQIMLRSDELLQIAKKNVLAGIPNTTVTDAEPITFANLKFQRFYSASPRGLSRCHLLNVHGEIAYQLTFTTSGNRATSDRFCKRIMRGFRLLDPEIASSTTHYDLLSFGVTADFGVLGAKAISRAQLKNDYPAALFGVRFPDFGEAMIFATDLRDIHVDDEILVRSTLLSLGVSYPDEISRSEPAKRGSAEGRRLIVVRKETAGSPTTINIEILRNGNTGIVLTSMVRGSDQASTSLAKQRLDAVTISPPESADKRLVDAKTQHIGGNIINDIGIAFYQNGEFKTANRCFESAIEIDATNETYVLNLVAGNRELGRFQEALETIEKHSQRFPGSLEFLENEAEILANLERFDEAIAKYSEAFASGCSDIDHLYTYLDLLVNDNQVSVAVAKLESFLTTFESPSVKLRRWHHSLLLQNGREDEAIEKAKGLSAEFPNNQDLMEDVVDLMLDADQDALVLQEVSRLKSRNIESATLGYYEGIALLGLDRHAEAKKSFERALDRAPNDPTLLEAIRQTNAMLGEGDNSMIKTPIAAVEVPDAIRQQIDDLPSPNFGSQVGWETRESISGVFYRKKQQRKVSEYRTIKLSSKSGVDNYKTLRFSFDPTYENAYMNQLEVLDEELNVVATGNIDTYYVTSDSDSSMATSDAILNTPVPGLKPGYTLRYVFTIEEKGSVSSCRFENRLFASSAESGPRAYFITGDIDDVVGIPHNGNFQTGRNAESAWWILPSASRQRIESMQPRLEEYVPWIVVGDRSLAWTTIANDYMDDLSASMGPESDIARFALSLTKDAKTEREKVNAILSWVQGNLTYQALEFGIRARIPNSAKQIIENRYGDCKDHSLIACQMLESIGIPCNLALIDTSGNLVAKLPSLEQFDHMIIYIPDGGAGRFIDCTSKHQYVGDTAAVSFEGYDALILDRDRPRFETIGSPVLDQNMKFQRVVRVHPNGQDFQVSETMTLAGGTASGFRKFVDVSSNDDQKRMIENMFSEARIQIQSIEIENSRQLDQPLVVSLDYVLPKALRQNGLQRSGNLPAVWENYFLELSHASFRHTPFEHLSKLEFESSAELILPDNMTVKLASGPQDQLSGSDQSELDNRWLSTKSSYSTRDNRFRVDTTFERKKGIFPADQYREYFDANDAALEAAGPMIVLQERDD